MLTGETAIGAYPEEAMKSSPRPAKKHYGLNTNLMD